MPGPRSHHAPFFSSDANVPITNFLREFTSLADACGLTDRQKVDAILRYVPPKTFNFWTTLPGYAAKDWTTFSTSLEEMYPDTEAYTCYTKKGLQELVDRSNQKRLCDENDVINYYRAFHEISNHLTAAQLSAEERNEEFFMGFHPEDREILSNRLYALKPNHPPRQAHDLQDVYQVARSYFSDSRFYQPLQRRLRNNADQRTSDSRWQDTQDPRQSGQDRDSRYDHNREYRRDTTQTQDSRFNTTQPDYVTKTVQLQDPKSSHAEEDRELEDIIRKIHGLSVRDPAYATLYFQCKRRFPDIAQELAKPELSQTSSVLTYQPASTVPNPTTAPAHQNWMPNTQTATHPSEADTYFRTPRRPNGCAFCTQQGHLIRECPVARDYVYSNRAMLKNNRIHFPNGQSIPNDGSNRGLKHSIDIWLANNSATTPDTSSQHPTLAPFQRDQPPHTSLGFEATSEVHMAQVTNVTEDDTPDSQLDELYDVHRVLANEKKKRESKAPKPQDPPAQPAATNVVPPPNPPATTKPASSYPRPTQQYRYQSNAEDQQLTNQLLNWLLEGKLAQTTPAHILAASAPIRKDLADRLRTRRVEAGAYTTPSEILPVELTTFPEPEYSLPLREVDVLVNDQTVVSGVVDPGSQIVAIRKDLVDDIAAPVNTGICIEMEGANGAINSTLGCVEYLTLQIGDIPFKIHAHVVEHAPFQLLLRRPVQRVLLSSLDEHPDGRVDIIARDPRDRSRRVIIPSRERRTHVGFVRTLAYEAVPPPPRMKALERYVANSMQPDASQDPLISTFAYKKAAKKVHPVAATLPEDFRIIRRRPEDPLLSLPPLPTHPPLFTPCSRLTQERLDDLKINKYNFLWPEEVKLAQHILQLNEKALAWTEAEHRHFRDDYFSPVKIPTIAHTPWVHKNIPIPTGILDEVIDILKQKIAAGVYEPSDASYRSRWFCVKKKNGSLRLVHDLQPLNAITIRNAAVPPFVDQFIESMAARSCYSMLDLFVGYDHRTLDVSSRDLTTFQTPLGAQRSTVLPQGLTNAVAIFHGDVTFILEPEIPKVAKPFVDDTGIKGPASRYETPEGGFETIPENDGIRRFIWEHLNDVHRILHRLGHAGATVSAPKLFIAAPEVIILGHKCTYEGRIPDDSKTAKVRSWPPCKTVSDVRAFLGTAGTMRIWIKNYSAIARPLVDLTRKNTDFVWEEQHDHAMQELKDAIVNSPALIPIDYKSSRPVFLAIDSSWRAVGWILSQECDDGQRRPSRFGSIAWNDHESRYSQPKIELYGLFRTLRALRVHIVGVTNLVVEMDAQYVKGMLSNPDVQPNAAMNRWIAAILLFDFKLVHIPADKHQGPDGLSRREPIPGEDNEEDDPEDWIDKVLSLGIWINNHQRMQGFKTQALKTLIFEVPPGVPLPAPTPSSTTTIAQLPTLPPTTYPLKTMTSPTPPARPPQRLVSTLTTISHKPAPIHPTSLRHLTTTPLTTPTPSFSLSPL